VSEFAVHNRIKSQLPESGNPFAIIMDCPTTTEVRLGKINVGSIQTVLDPMFKFAGIDVSSAMLTHAIQLKPAQDNLQSFFYKRSEYKNVKKETEWRSPFAPTQYGYLKPEYEQDIKRLWEEIDKFNPKVIIAMGGVALWALCGLDKVGSYRGSFIETSNKKYKVMPTYSPVAVLKNYSFRPTVLSDLKKATNIKKIDYIEREICIEPTYEEVKQFLSYCESMNTSYSPLSFDIETANDEITCIGFAPHKAKAMVVPFKKEDGKDFYDYHTELAVWKLVGDILSNPDITKVAQNQTYDVSWLRHMYGIEVRGTVHDTMHAQHVLQPELEKSLGYLGSIYTNEGAWKNLTNFSKSTKAEA
tara:strand:+ start:820 stop:1896 length:1077 start_codon:yes stop_codon:yes gene_type:complete